jgi:hypothetical protein
MGFTATKISSIGITIQARLIIGTYFTKEELETTRFGGIVDAGSQLTACYVQKNPQAAAMEYTEDTIEDCKSALETLTNWALTNGITPPSEMKKRGHILTELSYFYNNPDEVI